MNIPHGTTHRTKNKFYKNICDSWYVAEEYFVFGFGKGIEWVRVEKPNEDLIKMMDFPLFELTECECKILLEVKERLQYHDHFICNILHRMITDANYTDDKIALCKTKSKIQDAIYPFNTLSSYIVLTGYNGVSGYTLRKKWIDALIEYNTTGEEE